MPAAVVGMKAQTLGHVTISTIIVMLITGTSVARRSYQADPRKKVTHSTARELLVVGNRHV
jgi:putative effector of murein hydrolase LrgA (UPF0299 family)